MASEKPTSILQSKTDLTDNEIALLTDKEAWALIYSLSPKKDTRMQICMTGMSKNSKDELKLLANKHNFKIVSSITKSLDFLICGENAGPTKLEKANQQEVQILNEDEFRIMLITGELPIS